MANDDNRCPECGNVARPSQIKRYWRRQAIEQRGDNEFDALVGHLRAIVANCTPDADIAAIRHQLVGILPETQPMTPEEVADLESHDLGHLAKLHAERVEGAWAEYGYGEGDRAA